LTKPISGRTRWAIPLRGRADEKTTAALEKAAEIAIGRASFNAAVAFRLLRDRTVRRKVPRQSVGIDFASVDRSRRGVMT
jgi:hypothetical protein